LVVRGHEDRDRHRVDADGPHDFEAGHAGHLDVEKYEIGMQAVDRLHSGGAGVRRSDDRHTITIRE